MKNRPWWFYNQSGVIPYRVIDSEVEILLITTKRRARWIIPKGVIDIGTTARESAGKEAYEEAGVWGDISPEPVGEYEYDKWGGTCTVQVYLLRVHTILGTWPEGEVRRRQWMPVSDAANSVEQQQLKRLILSLPEYIILGRPDVLSATQ
jgi:8-oxo-dGTP pyrophosphatase MutT (NUDIX family)